MGSSDAALSLQREPSCPIPHCCDSAEVTTVLSTSLTCCEAWGGGGEQVRAKDLFYWAANPRRPLSCLPQDGWECRRCSPSIPAGPKPPASASPDPCSRSISDFCSWGPEVSRILLGVTQEQSGAQALNGSSYTCSCCLGGSGPWAQTGKTLTGRSHTQGTKALGWVPSGPQTPLLRTPFWLRDKALQNSLLEWSHSGLAEFRASESKDA